MRSRTDRSLQPPSTRLYSIGSSVYSQASPDRRSKQPRLAIPRSSSIYPDDVSPPDSPRTADGARSRKSSPNISPITDTGSIHHNMPSSRPYVSNIPLPRSQQSTGGATSVSGWRDKVGRGVAPAEDAALTRWDEYSGEPTNSEAGKPAQAIPGITNFDQLSSEGARSEVLGYSVKVIGGGGEASKASFSERLRRVGKKEANETPAIREEWKGASGRSRIVPPVADNPHIPAKPITPPHIKGSLKHTVGLRPRPNPGRTSPAGRVSPAGRDPQASGNKSGANGKFKAVQETEEPAEDITIRPTVPLKIGKNSPTIRTPVSKTVLTPEPKSTPPRAPRVLEDKAVAANKEPTPSPSVSPEEIHPDEIERQLAAATQMMNLSSEPGSRFSATTYNTTAPDSQPGSPRRSLELPPPLPTPPLSVLNRKRPVPSTGVSIGTKSGPPSRKPTPSQIETGTSKSLPQSPPEANAVDRVSLLQAKLDSLNRRRGNLATVIHELTHVVQPSSIAYDLASRQEIKKTVDGLNAESAAVAKEIHETGMKLHRAMKRRDEESMFEPTGLWVRRVTE